MSIYSSVPLLSKLKVSGGTFYTLSSTVNDFSYMFSDSSVRIAPSKFVAMKLPDWENTGDQHIFSDALSNPTVSDPNDVFPKFIQNYMENLVQYSEGSRTDNNLSNYSESAWWKTLRSLGGMEIEPTVDTIIEGGVTKTIHKEKASGVDYEPIIKYVGDVNLINHVKSSGNEYIEMFLNIPTEQGKMVDIKFKRGDISHPSGLIPIGGGGTYSSGLDGTYVHSDAIYDDTLNEQYEVGTDLEDSTVYFSDILGDELRHKQGDFDFNAIALYYDVYDKNDDTKLRTNLYGILLVEDFDNGGISNIPVLSKIQPSENSSGNGFSFRLNLKFSNATNQVTSEVSVNDYSTVSMELYMDALRRLNVLTDSMEEILETSRKIYSDNERLKTTVMKQTELVDSINQINTNKDNIQKIQSGDVIGASSSVRITNEELFTVFDKTLTELKNSDKNITLTNIISKKSYLGELVDEQSNIIEFEDGTRYQWDSLLKIWELI